MFNASTLAALLALSIGFRTTSDGAVDEPALLPAELLAADGTLALQDVHPLLTLRNLRMGAPQMAEAEFIKYLTKARETAAIKVLDALRQRKQLNGTGKRLLQSLPLTKRSGAYVDKIIREDRFVGLALRPRAGQTNMAIRITDVGTQFTQVEPGFKLVLLHSSDMATPVKEYPFLRADRVYFEWTPLEIDLSAKLNGTWYLGYHESDMSGQAIRLDQNLQQRPGQCCGSDYLQYDAWSPYVQVLPFSQASPGADITYQTNTNWGLNLQLEASCDLTQHLTSQINSFAPALRLQLAVDMLTMMANSTRNNGLEAQTKAMALMELNNRPNTSQKGFHLQLADAVQALDVDLSGVSSTCLPCVPKSGAVKYGRV
ncbi:hypothetical protein GCM10022406_25560 [Hymenobacter algoricola]|uniref:Uncharacterized protein n=2 Tax=Hymenobacter algoricola TaxID=486267 RepID=A0ABP7N988_9BACT